MVCSDAYLPAEQEGGLPFVGSGLGRGLAEVGADVRVVTTDRNGSDRLDVPTDQWVRHQGISVWYARSLPGPWYPAPSGGRALREAGSVDCVLGSGTLWTHLGLLAWRAGVRRRAPLIVYPQGLLDPWALSLKAIRKRFYWALVAKRIVRESAAVVAVSESERESVASLGAARRIEVIPNGVWIGDFAAPPARTIITDWLPRVAERPFVLFLGRIHEKKGLGILLEALARPAVAELDFVTVVAGPVDPDYRTRFERLVAHSPVRDRIAVVGPVTGARKSALLAHAALFVLPSFSEGLPVAALEALASGCPIVVSPECNIPEAAGAGAGLEVSQEPEGLARALASLLTQEDVRRAMGRRARVLARDRFDWRTIGERTLALCREVSNLGDGSTQVDR